MAGWLKAGLAAALPAGLAAALATAEAAALGFALAAGEALPTAGLGAALDGLGLAGAVPPQAASRIRLSAEILRVLISLLLLVGRWAWWRCSASRLAHRWRRRSSPACGCSR